MEQRTLKVQAVTEKLGIGRATIYRWMKTEGFPKPLKLGPRRVGWLESAIDAWLASRPHAEYQGEEAA